MQSLRTTILILLAIPLILLADTEPFNGFYITRGENDPEVPPSSEMNGDIAVMQIKTKHISGSNTLKKIKFKTLTDSVRFGNGIKSATLYIDENADGKIEGDPSTETIIFSSDNTFQPFDDMNIEYSLGETKYLLLSLNLDLKDGNKFQIEIPTGGVELSDNNTSIVGTPLKSKEYTYICDEDPNCVDNEVSDSDSSSAECGNSEIDSGEICDGNSKSCVGLNSNLYKNGTATCNPDCLSWNISQCEIDENYNPGSVDVDGCSITVL